MVITKFIRKQKKNIEMNHPRILRLLLMLQRGSTKPICDWPIEKAIKGDMLSYKRHMGYVFDIQNPVTFTEKLQWYKFFYHHDSFGKITDKYLFKKYVKDRIGDGHTIPLYGVWYNVNDLEKSWSSLPEKFVLKANLQSDGRNIKIIHNKSSINFKKIKSQLKAWLDIRNTLANSWEYNFYRSTPCILAEEYMSNFADQLYDYKLFCFNGEPYCTYVAMDHWGEQGSYISFYDLEWNKMNVKYGSHINCEAPCPKHYREMLDLAKILAKEFPFVRVDFFDTEDKLYVAELTFTPGGGVTKYNPESFNRTLGDLFILPKE